LYEGKFAMASTTFSGPVTSTNGFVGAVTGGVTGDVTGAITLPTYTVASAPTTETAGKLIYVSNGAAGSPIVAFGNGTSWLRCDTGAAISAS
jgi:hypothetical protein